MKTLWKKIKAIKGWYLAVPVIAVVAWIILRFIGRGLFIHAKETPRPFRYTTPDEEADARERIRDHHDRRREEDERKVSEARKEAENFFDDERNPK